MVPGARTSNPKQHAPFFDVHPRTGSRCSTPTGPWRRSAGAALVGSGGPAGAVLRQPARQQVRLLRATQPTGMRCSASAPTIA
jgi:hypothetical protein